MKNRYRQMISAFGVGARLSSGIGMLETRRLLGVAIVAWLATCSVMTVSTTVWAHTETVESAVTCREVRFPVALQEGQPASYEVVGQLCYKPHGKNVVQLLVSGATYGHGYWDFPVHPQVYSYVRALTGAGYATFNFDRIGIGESDHPPAGEVTVQASAFVIHQIAQALRDGRIGSFSKIILVGHSLGSAIALSEQAQFGDMDGLILTGFLHAAGPGASDVGTSFYPAQNDPRFATSGLPEGYFTTVPGKRSIFYATRFADPSVIAVDEATKETISLGEINTFPPLVFSPADAKAVHVPVLIAIGRNDNIFCTPPMCSEAQVEPNYYPSDARVELRVLPAAGHDLNLHFVAPVFFAIAREWSDRHFGK